MNTVVKADAEFVIWLIVGLFWVVAQIAGSAGKKKAPPRPPSEAGEGGEAPVDPFAELMRKLSGVQEFKIPTPPEPVEYVPAKAARSERLAPPVESESKGRATPPAEPNRREETRKPQPPSLTPTPIKVAEVDIRPTMNAFRNTLPAMRLPVMRLHFQCATHHDRDVDSGKDIGRAAKLELKDRRALRRAMLNHVVLGKPRGLDHWSPGTVE